MKILLLNLADSGDPEWKTKTCDAYLALRRKYHCCYDSVYLLNLLNFTVPSPYVRHNYSEREIGDMRNPDTVVIHTHGKLGDTNSCYCEKEPFSTEPKELLLSVVELAKFLKTFLIAIDFDVHQKLHIVLAMCFSARTENMRANHVVEESDINFAQSFAGKFINTFNKITECYKISLMAFTGELSFDQTSGEIEICTEEKIFNDIVCNNFRRQIVSLETQIIEIRRRYDISDAVWEEFENSPAADDREWTTQLVNLLMQLDKTRALLWEAAPTSPLKRIGYGILRIENIENYMQFTLPNGKVICYDFDGNVVDVNARASKTCAIF